jgi:hypothetical protein
MKRLKEEPELVPEEEDEPNEVDEDDSNMTDKPDWQGCCSWDSHHCGNAKGKCRGGIKACEKCKGHWIPVHPTVCQQGHSFEEPLPKIWDFSTTTEKHAHVKVLSYNLYWWKLVDTMHAHTAGQLVKAHTQDGPFDFMGLQECNWIYGFIFDAGGDGQYEAFHINKNICIAVRKAAWEVLDHGEKIVASDSGGAGQNYGQRAVMWVRARHKHTKETLFFANHHGPLPLSSGGQWGPPATARNLLSVISENGKKGDAVILVGDFNSQVNSLTIKQLGCRLNKVKSGVKFGGVDHIFTNLGNAHVVSSNNLGQGGSDHDALSAVFNLGSDTAVSV